MVDPPFYLAVELIVALAPVSIVAWLCWRYPEYWKLSRNNSATLSTSPAADHRHTRSPV
jgi:hypothetical protein